MEIEHNTWAKQAENMVVDTLGPRDEDCNNEKELEHEWLDRIEVVTQI